MAKDIKLHTADKMETVSITLTRETFPIAFQNKLDELMHTGYFDTEDEAIAWIESTPFEMELFYEDGYGLFLVEAEAAECGTVQSPYSGANIIE